MRVLPISLPVYLLSSLQHATSVWNIVKVSFGQTNSFHRVTPDNTLQVFYPQGSYSPSKSAGGIGFFASPEKVFMSDNVLLEYEVRFHPSFDPVLGGKLPGLFIGKGTSKKDMTGASGGIHSDASSIRVAWRPNFQAEAYVYLPHPQHPDYYEIPRLVENKIYGDSLWRGLVNFEPDVWNKVSVRVKLNGFKSSTTVPETNGVLELSVNNNTQTFSKIIWRTSPEYHITALLFETFFGGSTSKYATPVDTWTYFRNVKVMSLD
jgi:hypothetical protein